MADDIIFKDRASMNKFRTIIDKALNQDIITQDEANFAVRLGMRFRSNIEAKTRQLYSLQGEIARLKENENDIFGVAEDLLSGKSEVEEAPEDISSVQGLLVTINNRFKSELERKARALLTVQGELAQLRANENVLIDIVNNIIAAHERAMERDEAAARLRAGKEDEEPTE